MPSTIVDISKVGVRLLRPERRTLAANHNPDAADVVELTFELPRRWPLPPRSYSVLGTIIRSTAAEIVCVYEPPIPHWEAVLRAHDTFALTELVSF